MKIDPAKKKIATNKVINIINFRRINANGKRIRPSLYSNNPIERSMGNTLYRLKYTKRYPEKGSSVFYDNLDKLANDYSDSNLFSYVNKKELAITQLQEVADWIVANGRLPKRTNNNDIEFSHSKRLDNIRCIVKGTLQGIWYPELDEIMKSIGYPDYFKSNIDGVMIDSNVEDLLSFYKKNKRHPSQLSDLPEERKLYRKLIRLRQVKQGKTKMIWNPEIDHKIKAKKIKNIFLSGKPYINK